MNEHLVNNAEQFRNKVIEVNKEMENISKLMLSGSAPFYSEESRRDIMLEFYKCQNKINDLYKQDKESLYK